MFFKGHLKYESQGYKHVNLFVKGKHGFEITGVFEHFPHFGCRFDSPCCLVDCSANEHLECVCLLVFLIPLWLFLFTSFFVRACSVCYFIVLSETVAVNSFHRFIVLNYCKPSGGLRYLTAHVTNKHWTTTLKTGKGWLTFNIHPAGEWLPIVQTASPRSQYDRPLLIPGACNTYLSALKP